MKKYFMIFGLLALLIPLVFGDTFDASTASAQNDDYSSKISGLLALQVEAKLRALEAKPLEEGRVDILQAMQATGAVVMPPNKQRIFIHSVDKLGQSQIEELVEDIGLTLYLDSWIPPVKNHVTGFIIADMPLDKLNDLADKNYVMRLDTAEQFLEPHNDLAAQKINADDVWSANYTGANITIAVLDSGLDITHNDIPTPIASKDYSNYPLLDGDIANQVTGHGTHVTGSALGRGNQSGGVYKGMAPSANLVFLKIGNDTNGRASTAAMVNALKAAVDTHNADIITMSYGGWDSYHDGTSQTAQAVDYAVSQGAAVFISAGNYADDDWHYSSNASANSTTGYIQVDVTNAGNYTTALYFNLVWYDGPSTSNDLEMEYYSDNYTLLTSTNFTQSESSRGTESEYALYNYYVPSGNSTYFLRVKNNSVNSQFFHIYYSTGYNQSGAGSVKFNSPDPNYTIGTPADADSAIAVGAYTTREYWWNYANSKYPVVLVETVDQISTFSSRGPRVDSGAPPKPNIVAPGSAIISTRDTDIYTWPSSYNATIIDNDGPNTDNTTKNNGNGPADYFVMQGTSMASPLAAGVAALLLEKHPSWTPAQVKLALESTATDKGASGHDNIYGWGLLDALAASNADLIPPTMESIIEAEGQYYNTAPILSNFGFDDDVDLDDGWYQMNSYNGSWTVLFTNVAGTLWDSDNWSVPGFNELAEGSHTIYFKASDDAGNIEGEAGEWKWQFYKDITPPTNPTSVKSTSHSLSTWSSNNTINITWADATDNLSGLDGYSILWDTDNSTIPDQTKDIEEGVQATTSQALAEGNNHYFHIRSVDNVGNWQSTVHLGPFFIDTTPPTDPTSVNSTSHTTGVWSSDNTVVIVWTDATDNLSGLDGYSILWDTDNSTIPDAIKDIEDGVQATTSPVLADGNNHYFHIRSVDSAGNWQSTVHLGPFFIDTTPPTMELITETEGQYYNSAPILYFGFDDDVGLDDGWYQMDSYSGSWTVLFIFWSGTSWNSGNWTIPGFATLAEGSHTIYFNASDDAGNIEGESGEWSWQFFKDTVPPAGVTDLAASNVTRTAANLTWTAPGNDGNTGTAAIYDIRYSTSNITEANWDSATPCTGEPIPSSANATEIFTVTGLSDNTTYYFALKTADLSPNWSNLSNVTSATTLENNTPVLSHGTVSPASGYTSAAFTYSVNYTDADNDSPSSITVAIDGSTSENMTAKAGQDGNFANGEIYEFTISGANLGGGTHTFQFAASDGIDNANGDIGSHSGPTVIVVSEPTPPAGGGGEGGQPGVTSLLEYITQDGRFKEDVTCRSGDRNVKLFIPEDTIGKNRVGSLLPTISIKEMEEPPSPPEQCSVIGLVYRLGPDRATFDPPIDLTIEYDASLIPQGVAEKRLFIATFDTFDWKTAQWVELESTVDPEADTISANISHFSAVTVWAPTRPANFSVTDLSVTPKEVHLVESVSINVMVTNTGDLSGSYEVSLQIDDVVAQTKEVTLDGGDSETINFSLTPDTLGKYIININGLPGTFEVKPPKPPVPAAFRTSDLTISPTEVNTGESVTISATVANIGDVTGTYQVTLKIDGVVVQTKNITLDEGTSLDVIFKTTTNVAGTYTVDVDGLDGAFTVREKVPAAPLAPAVPQTPIPFPSPTTAPAPETNWWLIMGIIGSAAMVVLVSYLLVRKYSFAVRTGLDLNISRRSGQKLWNWFKKEVLKKQ